MGDLTSEILKDLIKTDKASKQPMQDGLNYYVGENDILKKDFRLYYIESAEYIDYNKSNEHIPNNYHKKLVDQKRGYMVGKPVTIDVESDDKSQMEAIQDVLGRQWQDALIEWVKGACNMGYQNLHPYIGADGSFKYAIITAVETIYITDNSLEAEVINVIRYYEMDWIKPVSKEKVKVLRAEIWDSEKVTYWQAEGDADFVLVAPNENTDVNENPQYHWYMVSDTAKVGMGWGKVPFVKLENNTELTTDLLPIKKYVDAVDIVSSGFINDLADIQLAIWVLRGYEGESLSEFMKNLQTFKAIKLSTDDNASAEPKTIEIPKEARVAILAWLDKKIYEIGQGVNEADLAGGSGITNVVIKAHYTGLDIKANTLLVKLEKAMYDFLWYVIQYINEADNKNYDVDDIKITFNKSMIFNEVEIVEMLAKSKGIISDETIIRNHPLVDDADKELELMEAEKAQGLKDMEYLMQNPEEE